MHPCWTLEEYMVQVAESDTIQHGSATVKPTAQAKASLKRMEDKPRSVGEIVCFKCDEKGHPARNCPLKDSIEELKRGKAAETAPAAGSTSSGKQQKGRGSKGSKTTKRPKLRKAQEGDRNNNTQSESEESDDDIALSESGKGNGVH
jgi:hypothetical protein